MFSFLKGNKQKKEEVVKENLVNENNSLGNNPVSLEKSVISLEKTLVSLEKKTGVNLTKHCAKVAVVLDYSGSMRNLYKTGEVQKVLNRLMPIALKFDDNGELDLWIFHEGYHRIASMDINNYSDFIQKEITEKKYKFGATCYAPVLEDILKKYIEEEKDTSNIPTFVIFITDGANSDKGKTNKVIRESSNHNIFIQFVGIGQEKFEYLEKLDDLDGRPVDNTGFIRVKDISVTYGENLYNLLLDQYPDWLKSK